MNDQLNPKVVLAALDDMLAPMTIHKGTHLSIMRLRAKRLRNHVAQYVEPHSVPGDRLRAEIARAWDESKDAWVDFYENAALPTPVNPYRKATCNE